MTGPAADLRHVIVVDVETSGLDLTRHSAVEVAWWNLTTGERGQFIPKHNVHTVLAGAQIEALRVNRYIDRIAGQPQDWTGAELIRLYEQFYDAAILAGSNPAFDARFLAVLFANLEDVEPAPWHHRLWDLSAYAAGVLGLDELPGLTWVCELLDVAPPDHTAAGDVTATGRCFSKLWQRAGARRVLAALTDPAGPGVSR